MLESAPSSRLALSIVVPCFNEEGGLAALCERICAVCTKIAHGSFELVLVNDGSNDSTLSVMQGLSSLYPALVIVNLSRNYGHQIALTAGLSICQGDRVLILDADLQDPPELLEPMMQKMDEEKADVSMVSGAQGAAKPFSNALRLVCSIAFLTSWQTPPPPQIRVIFA